MTPAEIADSVRQANAFVTSSRVKWVVIDYTNHRGVRSVRTIIPERVHFGTSPWHPEPQWLLDAADVAQGEERTFALAGVHGWRPFTQGAPVNA